MSALCSVKGGPREGLSEHKFSHPLEGSGLASCLANYSFPGASFSPDLRGPGNPLHLSFSHSSFRKVQAQGTMLPCSRIVVSERPLVRGSWEQE